MTGDNALVAGAVARQTGVDDFQAEPLPDQKHAFVMTLQEGGHPVGMIGAGCMKVTPGRRSLSRRPTAGTTTPRYGAALSLPALAGVIRLRAASTRRCVNSNKSAL